MSNEIHDVAGFLKEVKRISEKYPEEIVVYRGEDRLYDEPCKPNIFRKSFLHKSNHYEKNLLDSLKQHKLSDCENYLENAINAQHGEFPSRLLDVTYNCLIALYFAVTPYYHSEEEAHDNKPGQVYIFHMNKVVSPSAEETQKYYSKIIRKENNLLSENMIFGKIHIFIDHCKINHRIIAQQGAFILFQGEDAEPLPAYIFEGIRIPASSKKRIRKELKNLFGIHTGSIYPEIVNYAAELTKNTERITSIDYSFTAELADLREQFERELEYYLNLMISCENSQLVEIERIAEKVIYSYYLGVIQLHDYILKKQKAGEKMDVELTQLKKFVVDFYNVYLKAFQNGLIDKKNSSMNIERFIIKVGK